MYVHVFDSSALLILSTRVLNRWIELIASDVYGILLEERLIEETF